MVPSSSAHWVTGSTTSASAAVSEGTKSHDDEQVEPAERRRARPRRWAPRPTGLEPCTSSARGPPGVPSRDSSSTAGTPGPGRASGSTPQTAATWARAAGSSIIAVAGQLVALLAVLATALAVALTGERAVAAARRAGQAEREREVDRGGHGVGALASLLDARGR